MPTAVRIESAINTQLLADENVYVETNFSGLLRGDIKTRYEAYQIGINTAFLTPNDVRRLENLDTDENIGNKLLMQNQNQPLEDIEAGVALNEQKTDTKTEQKDDNETETN